MDDNIFLIAIFFIVLVAYLSIPVPSCIPLPQNQLTNIEPDASYNQEKTINISTALEQNGYILIDAIGKSMGDLENKRCSCQQVNDYNIGDIVAYYGANSIIGHRIIGITFEGDYILKGDSNNFVDSSLVKKEQIICKIPLVKRWELWKNQ